jgi:hypothetical protein
LAATGNLADREKFIGQSIKSVTIHEVGHTLGLRHNFKASTWKSMDEIMKTRDEDVPVSASVMDYNPSMFALEAEDQGVYLTTVVGPYDYWAIEYGYRLTDEEHSDEAELLKQIASRSAEPGHAYATDEDTTSLSPDPLVNRFDNGSDPLDYTRQRIAMANKLLGNIEEWALEDGESYNRLRKAFDMLLFEINRSSQFTARYVGGMYVNRDHKGDPNARMPFEVVPAAKQREALGYLVDNIFSDKSFQFKPELINKLGAGRWGHWDSDAFDSSIDYPIHERIEATQYWSMFQVLNPFTLSRVYDAEMKVPAGQETITVPELMASVARAVWSELLAAPDKNFTNRDPYISSIRRTLQRRHLELMIDVVLGEPGRIMPADAHAVARMTLKGISQQIDDVLTNAKAESLDAFTRAHLDESKVRIDKALDAQFSL